MGFVTVQEASPLTNRDEASIRIALAAGRLRGEWTGRRWMVDEDDLRRWNDAVRRNKPRATESPCRPAEVLALVAEWGDATAEEIARVMNRHVGNARKWLALLAADGLITRQDDGQWVLTPAGRCQTASTRGSSSGAPMRQEAARAS